MAGLATALRLVLLWGAAPGRAERLDSDLDYLAAVEEHRADTLHHSVPLQRPAPAASAAAPPSRAAVALAERANTSKTTHRLGAARSGLRNRMQRIRKVVGSGKVAHHALKATSSKMQKSVHAHRSGLQDITWASSKSVTAVIEQLTRVELVKELASMIMEVKVENGNASVEEQDLVEASVDFCRLLWLYLAVARGRMVPEPQGPLFTSDSEQLAKAMRGGATRSEMDGLRRQIFLRMLRAEGAQEIEDWVEMVGFGLAGNRINTSDNTSGGMLLGVSAAFVGAVFTEVMKEPEVLRHEYLEVKEISRLEMPGNAPAGQKIAGVDQNVFEGGFGAVGGSSTDVTIEERAMLIQSDKATSAFLGTMIGVTAFEQTIDEALGRCVVAAEHVEDTYASDTDLQQLMAGWLQDFFYYDDGEDLEDIETPDQIHRLLTAVGAYITMTRGSALHIPHFAKFSKELLKAGLVDRIKYEPVAEMEPPSSQVPFMMSILLVPEFAKVERTLKLWTEAMDMVGDGEKFPISSVIVAHSIARGLSPDQEAEPYMYQTAELEKEQAFLDLVKPFLLANEILILLHNEHFMDNLGATVDSMEFDDFLDGEDEDWEDEDEFEPDEDQYELEDELADMGELNESGVERLDEEDEEFP